MTSTIVSFLDFFLYKENAILNIEKDPTTGDTSGIKGFDKIIIYNCGLYAVILPLSDVLGAPRFYTL